MSLDLDFPDVWSNDFMPRHNFKYDRGVGYQVSKILEDHYPEGIARGDIVKKSGFPRTTIYDHLTLMMKYGLVYTKGKKIEGAGRPIVLFFLTEEPKALIRKLLEFSIHE